MTRRERPLTAQMEGALQWLASRGEMSVGVANEFIKDEVSRRTAWGLERRGYAERRWAGGKDATIYITRAGQDAADELLGCSSCGAPLYEDELEPVDGVRLCAACNGENADG